MYLLPSLVGIFITLNLCYQFLLLYTSPDVFAAPPSRPDTQEPKPKPRLHLNRDNTFKISIFSDLHFGESEDSVGAINDEKTQKVMEGILGSERPDFVVLSK